MKQRIGYIINKIEETVREGKGNAKLVKLVKNKMLSKRETERKINKQINK